MSEVVKVFVSHTSADKDFTQRLVGDLRDAGADIWVDFSNIERNDFVTEIDRALATCQWMILVVSPAALRANWVQLEANMGIVRLMQNRLRGILPVLAAPVDESLIPPTWSTWHRYDATRDYDTAVAGILSAIGLRSGGVTQPNTIDVDPQAQEGPRTITEALALAADNDQIRLWPHVYSEALTIDKPVQLIGRGESGDVILAPPSGKGLVVSSQKVRMVNISVWMGAPKDPQQVYAEAKADAIKGAVAEKAGGVVGIAAGAGIGLGIIGAIAAHVAFPPILIVTAGMAATKGLQALFSSNNMPSAPRDVEALQVLADASLELRDVVIKNSVGAGIVVRGKVEAYHCLIHHCKVAGCAVEGNLILEDSEVVDNAHGVFVTNQGQVSAHRNRILRNGIAVQVEGSGSGIIEDNVLGGNKEVWSIAKDRVDHVQRGRNVEDYRD
jgi:hypothetical protein